MISKTVGTTLKACITNKSKIDEVAYYCCFLEYALTVSSIALSYLIISNQLPPFLDSLKGRIDLANTLLTTALTLLVLERLFVHYKIFWVCSRLIAPSPVNQD